MEILIWGDNMKRQINISIFLAVLLIIMVWLYIKVYNERKPIAEEMKMELEVQKEASVESSNEYKKYTYCVKEDQGKIVVYSTLNENVVMETGIDTFLLPSIIQEKLEEGIFFESIEKLYDFLENYSS